MEGIKVNGFRRITKPQARKQYNNGAVVYICPRFLRPGSMWKPEVAITKADLSGVNEDASFFSSTENEFDKIVDEFIYYNCGGGAGSYPSFYIKDN